MTLQTTLEGGAEATGAAAVAGVTAEPADPALPPVTVPAVEYRRPTKQRDQGDVIIVVGAAVAAVSLTSVLAGRVVPGVGPVGAVVLGYLLFLVLYALPSTTT